MTACITNTFKLHKHVIDIFHPHRQCSFLFSPPSNIEQGHLFLLLMLKFLN